MQLVVVVIVQVLFDLLMIDLQVPRFALLVPFDLDPHLIVVHLFDQEDQYFVLPVVVQLVILLIVIVTLIQEALSFVPLALVLLVQALTVVVMRLLLIVVLVENRFGLTLLMFEQYL